MRTFRIERMPTYTFKVLDGCGDVEDEAGVSFRHRDRAIRYARDVVHELMRNREVQTRSWRLDVYENGDGSVDRPSATELSLQNLVTPGRQSSEFYSPQGSGRDQATGKAWEFSKSYSCR